jgi:hypothetical protein
LLLIPVILLTARTVRDARATATGAAATASANMRQFYLSKSSYTAGNATGACASGYHFASIWEIADPSALKYETSLGRTATDGGSGPPTRLTGFMYSIPATGWVRTGFSYSVASFPGQANCGTWLTNDGMSWGTTANLVSNWTGGEQDLGPWNIEVRTCNTALRVWCVQDDNLKRVYLPLVIR